MNSRGQMHKAKYLWRHRQTFFISQYYIFSSKFLYPVKHTFASNEIVVLIMLVVLNQGKLYPHENYYYVIDEANDTAFHNGNTK